ncbi:Ubiquitin carboxyl-terminal hydrolase 26 [Labeo rohita]|uniref:Ubiquitin carboxyl-terminal hydrolase 26 n=1 Tax=Labeo rohita TaxID=84645 RepID=A0ABQ8LZF2_LABRO|nr:Ubiquitin carboxyl-terminal hydrolase 26 [Labeo rohita]
MIGGPDPSRWLLRTTRLGCVTQFARRDRFVAIDLKDVEVGICILNYLIDWLVLAHSRDLVCTFRDVVLNHLAQLGLQVIWEKSKLSSAQGFSFLCVKLDSVTMTSQAPGAHGILSCGHAAGPDAYETAVALTSYLSPEMGMAPRHTLCVHHTFVLQNLQPLGTHFVSTGSGALGRSVQRNCYLNSCFQDRLGCRMQWACSLRDLDRPSAALVYHLPGVVDSASGFEEVSTLVQAKHVLVCTDNTATVAYMNHQGGVHSFRFLAGISCSGASTDSSLCVPLSSQANSLWYGLTKADRYRCIGTQLAKRLTQALLSTSEPHCTDIVQCQGGCRTDSSGSPVLAQQNLVLTNPYLAQSMPDAHSEWRAHAQ